MRAVVQRVSDASVAVGERIVGSIGPGLLVFVGVTHGDSPEDAAAIAAKLARLRVFRDDDGKMNLSVLDIGGNVLVVSQFTLYAGLRRGNRPSFVDAADPGHAEPLVEELVGKLAALDVPVATGEFGAMMDVQLTNDGPVTLVLESVGGRLR